MQEKLPKLLVEEMVPSLLCTLVIDLSTVPKNFDIDSKQLVSVHQKAGPLNKICEKRNRDSSIVFPFLW